MTLAEVKSVYDLKMTKGKYRPMLMKYPQQWSAKAIETKRKSFRHVFSYERQFRFSKRDENIERAFVLFETTRMKGIGTATASLILSIYDPRFPFLSDEAIVVVIPSWKGSVHATNYTNFVAQIQKKRETVRGEKHSR